MLRITHSRNASGAAKYFDEGLQRADYFVSKEQTIGEWGGKGAERLGLSGEVMKEDFVALCNNQKPDGSKLNPRHSDTRKVGYDFTFSVPKSVSIAYAINGDERIRSAFEQSVETTMRELEQNMRTQIGQGKDKQHVVTGEMVWASFSHRTSRPVNGVPDPHLHRHCFAMNTTWNKSAERFQSGEFGSIKKMAPYYEAAFKARMAVAIQKLGYQVERRGQSWEIQGIEKDTIRKFSRRTTQIEEKAAKEQATKGRLTDKQKDKLGALTRAKKVIGQSWESLRKVWRSWLTGSEASTIAQTRRTDAGEKTKRVMAKEAVTRASDHLFERKSVVRDYQLKAEALKRGYGDVLPESIQHEIDRGDFHQREVNGQNYITTKEAVEEEYKMLASVREGRGKHFPLNAGYQPKADYLNDEQRAAIHHALNDTNQVTIIAGGAGTGKTTLMKEVRDGIEAQGKKLIGFAPSAAASRGVMREEGFDKADTMAQLIHNPKMQEQCKDSVIWVDEAGLIGNKDMNRLLEIAKQQNARLLLTGDIRQHSSVAAGDALRILEKEAGLPVARVNKIQRQRDNHSYKKAVRLASECKPDAALYKLDRMGDVIAIENGHERLQQLVQDYAESNKAGKSALIVSPTHIEGRDVTETLRDHLKSQGHIQGKERAFLQLKSTNWTEENKADQKNYQESKLVVEFHQNAVGHIRGERWQVEQADLPQIGAITAVKDGEKSKVDLKLAQRFTVYRQQQLQLSKGDKIRITKGGETREGTRINNGDLFTINGFTRDGHIKLHNGKTLNKDFGHITHGYVTTSHSSQGKTVDHVFIAQSAQSLPATTTQQFYVSISRGRERCRIYTDDKKALEQSVKRDGQRMTARQIVEIDQRHKRHIMERSRRKNNKETQQSRHYGRNTEL